MLMTLIIGFQKTDIVKVILNPTIVSLNDFLAIQINKIVVGYNLFSQIKDALQNLLMQFLFTF